MLICNYITYFPPLLFLFFEILVGETHYIQQNLYIHSNWNLVLFYIDLDRAQKFKVFQEHVQWRGFFTQRSGIGVACPGQDLQQDGMMLANISISILLHALKTAMAAHAGGSNSHTPKELETRQEKDR